MIKLISKIPQELLFEMYRFNMISQSIITYYNIVLKYNTFLEQKIERKQARELTIEYFKIKEITFYRALKKMKD